MRAKTNRKMNEIEKKLQRIRESQSKADLAKRIKEVEEYIKQEHEPLTEAKHIAIAKALAEDTGRPISDFL